MCKAEEADTSATSEADACRPQKAMISKNLARRLERLEESLVPANEEPTVIKIIYVTPDGQRVDGGIEYTIPVAPKPFKRRRR